MRLILLGIMSIFLTVGCASLRTEIYEGINVGDPSSKVTDLLGSPQEFRPSEKEIGGQAWYYTRREDICGFTIKDGKVAHMMCTNNPNYMSAGKAFGTLLIGMGDGLKAGSKEPSNPRLNCYKDYGSGSYICQ